MPRYQPALLDRRRPPENPPTLPRGFTPIRELLDENFGYGRAVSVVGVVKDHRLPAPTRGTDYKCTLTLCDISTEAENDGIDFNIFRKQDEMPKVDAGDVVIAFMAKYQTFGGTPNLLSQFRTDIHVYEAQRLPSCRNSGSAWAALKKTPRKSSREPDAKENEYVLWLFDRIDKSIIPDQEEFTTRAHQSLNIKEKFSLLKDVRDQKFADIIVQVVKEPYDYGDKIGVWVSDYTEHARFFERTRDGAAWTNSDDLPYRDGDPYGYTSKFSKKPSLSAEDVNKPWVGPYGKKSIQLTCWEPHADFIRHNVHAGDWVRMRNVQIGFGHSSINIEGFLREDRSFPNRLCVDLLNTHADRETIDPRLLDALRRKRDCERDEKHLQKTGEKRKAEAPPKRENARSKRQRKRENKFKAVEEQKARQEATLNLNDLIKCENQDKALVPLSTIIEPVTYHTTINQTPTTIELPFTCAKFRTQARVVDFHPPSLKDFAVRRRVTEYDALTDDEDNDGDGDSDSCPSSAGSRGPRGYVWEWRFALKLEEPSSSSAPPPRAAAARKPPAAAAWVLVDNMAAQLLTGLDAADLRCSEARLAGLRERMFALWGNLEERKSRVEAKRRRHLRNPLQAPPADSSDVENDGVAAAAAGGGGGEEEEEKEGEGAGGHGPASSQLSNKPFECCVRQYGVRVKAEEEEGEAGAGVGRRWVRVFGLFGTKIASD